MTAEQLIPIFRTQLTLVCDPKEIEKIHRWMLGVAESKESRKKRLHAMFDAKERYKIEPKPKRKRRKKPSNGN
ncbi:hypothetical protein [Riemerella anatipestifer]|uniref:hypothetical protein n=1 Tax=Riemerella anatipestifer TaxID=34085 RepID=UPI0007ED429D|nr:hypothetical protein [Riemerella anatipestifer]MCU7582043.1 hypothetical protein [Riemerella anatipestifer]MCW0485112.1 hypothetical protein [Riemerella anatipestifer]OBP64095.1 hypothetical protein AWB84_02585 [Riemerella anatipestifer]